ncbi:hypothetical protein QE152_g5924 [Popillia japonica]|uniref:Uncharacterized protein n=1 Tax=Popillia japonica TaxID=7064 RepID=A0AAW1ML79_POPJA
MAGDTAVMEQSPPQSKQKRKRPTSSKPKRRRSATTKPAKPPSASSSKAKLEAIVKTKLEAIVKSTSAVKATTAKIPIWQRTPPSVIEEIQLTVKKQATKSQYREFLRALKSIAKKERSQVHVMPCEYKEAMEKQQETAFNDTFKQKALKRRKDYSKIVEETQFKKSCQNCLKEKCTCGVVVENASSQQKMHWMHVRSDSRRGIQAYDILDEITLKDLEPIQSEYPRKDHISDTDANKRIEETLLYKLLYHEDPKVLEGLLSSTPASNSKIALQITNSISSEKQKSASNAYKLYEELEFNTEKDKPLNLSSTKASMCIASTEPQKFVVLEKPRPLHTCPKEFNDEVNIPADLKPTLKTKYVKRKTLHAKSKDEEAISMRSRKRIEDKLKIKDKLKIIGKTSSIKSIGKRIRNGKISKENIKAKLKGYNVESDMRMKKILTIMPVSIVRKSKKKRIGYENEEDLNDNAGIHRTEIQEETPASENRRRRREYNENESRGSANYSREFGKNSNDEENTTKMKVADLQITPENLEKIQMMSKREIIQILKPYIFYDLQPSVIVAMPVIPKYNHQNKQQQDSPPSNRSTTYKRVSGCHRIGVQPTREYRGI